MSHWPKNGITYLQWTGYVSMGRDCLEMGRVCLDGQGCLYGWGVS